MYNPRFPHTLKVLRPLANSNGQAVLDDDGNPSLVAIPLDKAVCIDGEPQLDADGRFITEQVKEIEFGYRRGSLNARDTGDVSVLMQQIALPIFTTVLKRGDILEMTDFDRTYRGQVIKKQTFNLGTNIWFDEIRN